MTGPQTQPGRLRDAATVITLRDGVNGPEVLLIRRRVEMEFFGGAHVFPGGALDTADLEAAGSDVCDGRRHAEEQLAGMSQELAVAFHVAAIRELFEEVGILIARDADGHVVSLANAEVLDRFGWYRAEIHAGRLAIVDLARRERLRLALDALVLFAHWVTPPVDTRRYDTRFFIAAAPPRQIPAHDASETTERVWVAPAQALAEAERGVIQLPPPTWITLRELEAFSAVGEAIDWARQRTIDRREPAVTEDRHGRTLLVPIDPRHPVTGRQLETRFEQSGTGWRPLRS